MLILTRRINESLVIGQTAEISVTVLNVKGGQVRLGISAAEHIPVHREEIYQKIQAEKVKKNLTLNSHSDPSNSVHETTSA